jgi:DNA-directed RNA polymerase specialized sigma24 family protein
MLRDAIGRLPAPCREVVVLRYVEGRTWGEIGGQVGYSERHVRGLGEQAQNLLRGMLEGRV